MIFKASRLKASQEEIENLNEDGCQNTGSNSYKDILGLSYGNNYNDIIPTRLKWGKSLIRIID